MSIRYVDIKLCLNQTKGKFWVVSDEHPFLEILDLSIIHLRIDNLLLLSSGES